MALFFECMPKCAQKPLDTADIVRDAIYRQFQHCECLATSRPDDGTTLKAFQNADQTGAWPNSAFTPLDMALRDCGIRAFAIVGIAMEIGIEPTVRHSADLGYIPVVVKDACGFGHCDAEDRSVAVPEFAGDALLTNVETVCAQFGRIHSAR
jgi:nicotinamidase-related amidase